MLGIGIVTTSAVCISTKIRLQLVYVIPINVVVQAIIMVGTLDAYLICNSYLNTTDQIAMAP